MKVPINPNELSEVEYEVYLAHLRYERDIAPYPQTLIGGAPDPVSVAARNDMHEADFNYRAAHQDMGGVGGAGERFEGIVSMASIDAQRENKLDRLNLSRDDLMRLLEQVNLTANLVITAKEAGSSMIPVSSIADPISDGLRDIRDHLIRQSQIVERVMQRKLADEARKEAKG